MTGLWVACDRCKRSFPVETHYGLVKCSDCADRTAYFLPHTEPAVVEVQ